MVKFFQREQQVIACGNFQKSFNGNMIFHGEGMLASFRADSCRTT
jgi:hypothetical protein